MYKTLILNQKKLMNIFKKIIIKMNINRLIKEFSHFK